VEQHGGTVGDRCDLSGGDQATSLVFALGGDGVTQLLKFDAVTIKRELGHDVLSVSIVGEVLVSPTARTFRRAFSRRSSPARG